MADQINIDRFTHPKLVYDPLRHRPERPDNTPKAKIQKVAQPPVMDLSDDQLDKLLGEKP
jgi:hypothetical protein